jgi:hypothetical protein
MRVELTNSGMQEKRFYKYGRKIHTEERGGGRGRDLE